MSDSRRLPLSGLPHVLVNKPSEFAVPEGREFNVLDAVKRAEVITNQIVNTVVI